jgi:predicted DCC family thiol-disulfide oxidoreductase YuxK
MARIINKKKTMAKVTTPVILYDGVCNFCNGVVNFIIKKDKEKIFRFAPIQSKEARMLLRSLNEQFADLKTVYLVKDKTVLKRSSAIFEMLQYLPRPYKYMALFRFLPLMFTDYVYKIIAKNRYKWFGKKEEVIKPNEAVKERFITTG